MKIGIIGAGRMGAGLGRLWAKRGHHLIFSYSRTYLHLEALVEEIGSCAQAGSPEEAVLDADVVLLAVPWSNIGAALAAAGSLEGKTLLTCVNPIGPHGVAVELTSSAAEEIARLAPGAHVVEGFNTIFASHLPARAHLFTNDAPTVFYCGSDRSAKARTAELVRDAGFHAIDAGPLQNARYLESLAMLMRALGYSQRLGSDIALRLLTPSGPSESVKSAETLARAFVEICSGAGARPASEKILSEDFVAHLPFSDSPIRGRERFESELAVFKSAFSGLQCVINDVILDGMQVAVQWTWRGIHTGMLLGIAPTRRKVAFTETHLLRISGGRIAEDHVSANLLDLLHQLGASQFAAA
jgi:8-hydroxy-5-deazaflavin:NADPH oxidoreductase